MNETSTSSGLDPVGFLGGAFDPVHTGHLRGALAAREHLSLGRVDLIPAAQSPLKSACAVDATHRLAMLQLAVAGIRGIGVDARELDQPGPSYTVDTLAALRSDFGSDRSLVWIIGSDNLCTLPRWARWQDLLDFAHLAILDRPGASPPPPQVAEWLTHYEGRAKHGHAAHVGRQRDRPTHFSTCTLGRVHDLCRGLVKNTVIECLQSDSDILGFHNCLTSFG